MNKKTQIILEIIVGIVIVIGGVYFTYVNKSSVKEETVKTEEKATTTEIQSGISIEGDGDYKVEINPVKNEGINIPIPDLDRKIVFSGNIPVKTQEILRKNIENISAELKKDSNLVDNWIELGTYRKNTGDYSGAIVALNYAVYLNPSNSLAYNNIGDLYAYFLKDNVLAERNFLKAIEKAPKDTYLYFKTSEFYKDVLKNSSAARAIVEKGIKENPSSKELKNLLKSL